MYSMSEFCKMVGLPKSSIIFYEKNGLLKTKRNEKGYRTFTPKDAFRINAFLNLLQYGFTVEQAIDMLDKKQSGEDFLNLLAKQKEKLSREAKILEYRTQRIDKALKYITLSNKDTIETTYIEDHLYCPASVGNDFSLSKINAESLELLYSNLSISRCSRIINVCDLYSQKEEVSPSYINAIPKSAEYLLGDYNKDQIIPFKIGKCVVYTRSKTREESVQTQSFKLLLNYINDNNLKIRGDQIILFPSFLNIDGKGTDIECVTVPVY